jgi:hypothetical protein
MGRGVWSCKVPAAKQRGRLRRNMSMRMRAHLGNAQIRFVVSLFASSFGIKPQADEFKSRVIARLFFGRVAALIYCYARFRTR